MHINIISTSIKLYIGQIVPSGYCCEVERKITDIPNGMCSVAKNINIWRSDVKYPVCESVHYDKERSFYLSNILKITLSDCNMAG